VELIIFPLAFVIILLFAAVVRVLGTDKGYKVLFVVIALLTVLNAIRPGFMAVIGR
jgi:hypothetical protein